MAFNIRRVEYFHTTIEDRPGEGYKLLRQLASGGVNLLAFTAVPTGPVHAELTVFPDDSVKLAEAAQAAGAVLHGPHPAFLVQGDDELGAIAGILEKLSAANVNVYASSGVTDGRGTFGYILYIRPEEMDNASAALGV